MYIGSGKSEYTYSRWKETRMAKKKKAKKAKKKIDKKKKAPKKKATKTKKKTKKKPAKKKARKKAIKKKRKKPAKKKAAKKKTKKGKRGKRHTAKQRAKLVDKYHELRKGGLSADKAAKKVGVSYITLLKWEKKSGKKLKSKRGRPPGKKAALKKALKAPKKRGRPKKETKSTRGHTLVTPTGFRIEGISTSELIRVLKELK